MSTATLDIEAVYREHRSRMFWAAWRRLGENWHDAEDVVQDAFLKAFEQRNQYVPREGKPPQAWLMSLAKWEALTFIGQRSRYIAAGDWAERFTDSLPDRDTSTGLPCMADPEVCATVYTTLAGLSDQQRLAITMYCLSGCDRAEVGRCLRLPAHETDALIYNAMRVLQRRTPTSTTAPTRVTTEIVRHECRAAQPCTEPENGTTRLAREVARQIEANPAFADLLTERQREVVALLAEHNLSRKDAARALGVSYSAVEVVVRAAAARIEAAKAGKTDECRQGTSVADPSPHLRRYVDDPELLTELPPRWAEAIRLRYIEGLRQVDAAERMGITVKALSGLLNSAMLAERAKGTGVGWRSRHGEGSRTRGRKVLVAGGAR